jgi:hypothetical protein
MPRLSLFGLAFIPLLSLGGCAVAPLGAPVPSTDNITRARAAAMPPLAVGEFKRDVGMPPGADRNISLRTNTLYSPYDNSFAAYLREAVSTDLRAAGLLDPSSPLVLSGYLTDSHIELPSGTAHATVAARFVLTRAGSTVYDKELRARAEWQAGFVGIEAIPMAINRYQLLYRELTGMLLADPQFQGAVRR